MKHLKKFNSGIVERLNEGSNEVIEHYLIRQKLEVKGLMRKQGNGDDIEINGVGVIKEIRDFGDDIAYIVEFDIDMTHRSPYGSEWQTSKNTFNVFHLKDKENIVNVI